MQERQENLLPHSWIPKRSHRDVPRPAILRSLSLRQLGKMLAVLSVFAGLPAQAQQINSSYFGWMDQHSLNAAGFNGDDACAPTSSTNALTFLQNYYPTIFHQSLTGTSYEDWQNTDLLLAENYMFTGTTGGGTSAPNLVGGLLSYLQDQGFGSDVQFSGMYHTSLWSPDVAPSFIVDGTPTPTFIAGILQQGGPFIASIDYLTEGGHIILVNGISWDSDSNSGTLDFIDPLNPSSYDSNGQPTNPIFQTTGTLSIDPSNGELELVYNQYHGALPYSGEFSRATADIRGGFGILVVPEPQALFLLVIGIPFLAYFARPKNRFSRFGKSSP